MFGPGGSWIGAGGGGGGTALLKANNLSDLNSVSTALTNLGFNSITQGQVYFGNGTSLPASSANLFWDSTNNRLGINTTSPGAALDVHRAATGLAQFNNTGTQGSSGGAGVNLFADPGAALSSGSRLGFLGFGGAFDNTSTLVNGAAVTGFATENWSSTARGSKIVFQVTVNTTTGLATALTINQDKTLTAAAYGAGALQSDSSGNITSGTLGFANGGTGATSFAAGPIKSNGSTFATTAIDLTGTDVTGQLKAASFPVLTGDVTTAGGSLSTTIASSAVTNAKMANMNAHTYKGNNTGSSAAPIDLTQAQLTAELNQFTTSLQGLVPGSSNTTNFLQGGGWVDLPTSRTKAGQVSISSGATSKAITFATARANTNYTPIAFLLNTTDTAANMVYTPVSIVAIATTGFTAEWGENQTGLPTANYKLYWAILEHNDP